MSTDVLVGIIGMRIYLVNVIRPHMGFLENVITEHSNHIVNNQVYNEVLGKVLSTTLLNQLSADIHKIYNECFNE